MDVRQSPLRGVWWWWLLTAVSCGVLSVDRYISIERGFWFEDEVAEYSNVEQISIIWSSNASFNVDIFNALDRMSIKLRICYRACGRKCSQSRCFCSFFQAVQSPTYHLLLYTLKFFPAHSLCVSNSVLTLFRTWHFDLSTAFRSLLQLSRLLIHLQSKTLFDQTSHRWHLFVNDRYVKPS